MARSSGRFTRPGCPASTRGRSSVRARSRTWAQNTDCSGVRRNWKVEGSMPPMYRNLDCRHRSRTLEASTPRPAPPTSDGDPMDLLPSAHSDTFARDRLPPSGQWPELVFDIDDVRYPERLNCAAELLGGALERFGPDRRCLITDAETWTYGELDERSDQVAHVLADDLDIVPGNRVLLCGPNSPWLVACWLGVLKAGAVVVTVVPPPRAARIAALAQIAQ